MKVSTYYATVTLSVMLVAVMFALMFFNLSQVTTIMLQGVK